MTPTPEEIEAVARAICFSDCHVANGCQALGRCLADAHNFKYTALPENAIAAITALSALGWQRVPEGFVVVPREPTHLMCCHGRQESLDADYYEAADIYRAMIQAALKEE